MDLIQLRADLARLGVTLTSSLDPAAIAAVLPGQREYRASLYMPQLLDVEDFLTNPNRLALALGPAITQFVRPALDSFDYNALALQYDFWIGPAVQIIVDNANAASIADYQNYFINNILDQNVVNYNNNLNNNFYTPFPIMQHLLTQLTTNLENNIQHACTRIYNDRNTIANLFIDQYPALTLLNLTGIAPTGSDFHKGGQQVLILTFSTRWWWGPGDGLPWWSDLKVVYKPADVEVDCLLVGNSAAANRALANPGFLNASLIEIFNAEAVNNPGPNLKQLPTYRILPMNRTSAQPGPPAQVPIRNAYGYLEYLGYEWTGIPDPIFNLYLTGASDYMIYRTQPEAPIITDFYHQIGHWVAITTLFSLGDLHGENVRVRNYQPHLIDLEISLTEPFNNVADSGLFAHLFGLDVGGITGRKNNREDWVWHVTVAGGHVDLDKPNVTKRFQNRLYALRPGKKIVPVNAFLLLQGLRAGMVNLRGCHPSLAGWFGRLNNVLVRVLPYGTQEWKSIRAEVYTGSLLAPGPPQVNATIQDVLQDKLDVEFGAYNPAGPGLPDFIVMQPGTVLAPAAAAIDLRNFDIPAFYHRIGTTQLLDSDGNVIAVPAQVTVHDNHGQLAAQNTNAPLPLTYFGAVAPTTAVRNNQVNQVANPNINAFFNLVGQMERQTISPAALNVAMPPDAGVLIP